MGIASGELARRAGISADTLRHYERVGVLAKPARSRATAGSIPRPHSGASCWSEGRSASVFRSRNLKYAYEASPQGGRVVISTSSKEALAAVHEFLKFQIKDHATGDPLTAGSR